MTDNEIPETLSGTGTYNTYFFNRNLLNFKLTIPTGVTLAINNFRVVEVDRIPYVKPRTWDNSLYIWEEPNPNDVVIDFRNQFNYLSHNNPSLIEIKYDDYIDISPTTLISYDPTTITVVN
jgi:hypothetical protein